jgi:hypothetical protein
MTIRRLLECKGTSCSNKDATRKPGDCTLKQRTSVALITALFGKLHRIRSQGLRASGRGRQGHDSQSRITHRTNSHTLEKPHGSCRYSRALQGRSRRNRCIGAGAQSCKTLENPCEGKAAICTRTPSLQAKLVSAFNLLRSSCLQQQERLSGIRPVWNRRHRVNGRQTYVRQCKTLQWC